MELSRESERVTLMENTKGISSIAGLALLCVPLLLPAQVVLHSDDIASSGAYTAKNLARDAAGGLHCVSLRANAAGETELIVQSSSDGGSTWIDGAAPLNDTDSGLVDPYRANQCSVAIDDQGTLHILWGRYHYPDYYQQYYRRHDPSTGALSPVIVVGDLTGATTSSRTAGMDIIVDGENRVWLAGQGPLSWVEHLLASAEPYAAGDAFNDLGPIRPTAPASLYSAQSARLAVAPDGRVHCTYYRNLPPGLYEHRIHDPATGWETDSSVLGDTIDHNDYFGWVAADLLGNVHAVYARDTGPASTEWKFRYRRWEAGTWGDEVVLFDATEAQFQGISGYRIFNLAVDEVTGHVTAVYRDLSAGGPLVLAEKALGDPEFTQTAELQPPTLEENVYIWPAVRGTLYPAFNRAAEGLHITYQLRDPTAGLPPSFIFHAASGGGPPSQMRRGDCNDDGGFNIADAVYGLSALFVPGTPPPLCPEACNVNDDDTFNIADLVYVLTALFIPGAPPPPAPHPDCGPDPTPGSLECPLGSAGCP